MRNYCILIAGGVGNNLAPEDILGQGLHLLKPFSIFPKKIECPSLVQQNGTLLLCGGAVPQMHCTGNRILDRGTWKKHSTLNEERVGASAVTVNSTVFLFGGNKYSYEYLEKDSNVWKVGKNNILGNRINPTAIAVSNQEIYLIGGQSPGGSMRDTPIISFNVNDHTFKELPIKLNVPRYGAGCAFLPGTTNKVIITGGKSEFSVEKSTEILDLEDGSIICGNSMNIPRAFHGIGVITINDEDKLAVFGGQISLVDLDDYNDIDFDTNSVECYNSNTNKWEITNIKLKESSSHFGFLSVKQELLFNQL